MHGLRLVLAILISVKLMTHCYLDLKNSDNGFELTTRYKTTLSMLRFYTQQETGINNIIKFICNCSYFLTIILSALLLIIHFMD